MIDKGPVGCCMERGLLVQWKLSASGIWVTARQKGMVCEGSRAVDCEGMGKLGAACILLEKQE